MSDSATAWIAARQASLSITNSWSLIKFMSIESVMPSSHQLISNGKEIKTKISYISSLIFPILEEIHPFLEHELIKKKNQKLIKNTSYS